MCKHTVVSLPDSGLLLQLLYVLLYGLSNSSNCNDLECLWRSFSYSSPFSEWYFVFMVHCMVHLHLQSFLFHLSRLYVNFWTSLILIMIYGKLHWMNDCGMYAYLLYDSFWYVYSKSSPLLLSINFLINKLMILSKCFIIIISMCPSHPGSPGQNPRGP